MARRVILLVDDARFAKLTKTFLLKGEEGTNEVVVARDGVEAIEYLFHPGEALRRCRAWYSWTSTCLRWTASGC